MITQGGQLLFFLHDVKIPFFISVLLFFEITELPFSFGSFSGVPKILFLRLILTSLPNKIFSFIFKKPLSRKYLFFSLSKNSILLTIKIAVLSLYLNVDDVILLFKLSTKDESLFE